MEAVFSSNHEAETIIISLEETRKQMRKILAITMWIFPTILVEIENQFSSDEQISLSEVFIGSQKECGQLR